MLLSEITIKEGYNKDDVLKVTSKIASIFKPYLKADKALESIIQKSHQISARIADSKRRALELSTEIERLTASGKQSKLFQDLNQEQNEQFSLYINLRESERICHVLEQQARIDLDTIRVATIESIEKFTAKHEKFPRLSAVLQELTGQKMLGASAWVPGLEESSLTRRIGLAIIADTKQLSVAEASLGLTKLGAHALGLVSTLVGFVLNPLVGIGAIALWVYTAGKLDDERVKNDSNDEIEVLDHLGFSNDEIEILDRLGFTDELLDNADLVPKIDSEFQQLKKQIERHPRKSNERGILGTYRRR